MIAAGIALPVLIVLQRQFPRHGMVQDLSCTVQFLDQEPVHKQLPAVPHGDWVSHQ